MGKFQGTGLPEMQVGPKTPWIVNMVDNFTVCGWEGYELGIHFYFEKKLNAETTNNAPVVE